MAALLEDLVEGSEEGIVGLGEEVVVAVGSEAAIGVSEVGVGLAVVEGEAIAGLVVETLEVPLMRPVVLVDMAVVGMAVGMAVGMVAVVMVGMAAAHLAHMMIGLEAVAVATAIETRVSREATWSLSGPEEEAEEEDQEEIMVGTTAATAGATMPGRETMILGSVGSKGRMRIRES